VDKWVNSSVGIILWCSVGAYGVDKWVNLSVGIILCCSVGAYGVDTVGELECRHYFVLQCLVHTGWTSGWT
jgi:hypothetical protein